MNKITKLSILLIFLNFHNIATEDTCTSSNPISIYNINDGIVLQSYWKWWTTSIHSVRISDAKSAPNRINWSIKFIDDFVAFQNNEYTKMCLVARGHNKDLNLGECNFNNAWHLFELIPVKSGAYMLKVKNINQCIYSHFSWFHYTTGTKECPDDASKIPSQFLWQLIPPFHKDGVDRNILHGQ